MNRGRMRNESGDLEGAGETPALPGSWPMLGFAALAAHGRNRTALVVYPMHLPEGEGSKACITTEKLSQRPHQHQNE